MLTNQSALFLQTPAYIAIRIPTNTEMAKQMLTESNLRRKAITAPSDNEVLPTYIILKDRDIETVYDFARAMCSWAYFNKQQANLTEFVLMRILEQVETAFKQNPSRRPYVLWQMSKEYRRETIHATTARLTMRKAMLHAQDENRQESARKLIAKAQANADLIHGRLMRAIETIEFATGKHLAKTRITKRIVIDEDAILSNKTNYADYVSVLMAEQEIEAANANRMAKKEIWRFVRQGRLRDIPQTTHREEE